MAKASWDDRLARTVRDTDGTEMRTRRDAANYMAELPELQGMSAGWQAAAKLVLDGADVNSITSAVELALLHEGRLDLKHANSQHS